MTGSKKHLNTRAMRIVWSVTCGYESPETLIVQGKVITLAIETLHDSYEFSDDVKVYTYRQAIDRIERILYDA